MGTSKEMDLSILNMVNMMVNGIKVSNTVKE